MKKILIIILMFIISLNMAYANSAKTDKIKFNGNKYYLLYSAKNPELDGYLNEYYKRGETYNLWSEMVAVHHFPNAYSPLDRVQQFRKYLSSINCPSALTFNDKKNIAMIDFLLIHRANNRTLLEFNVFKYEKSKKCGSNAIQYAKRYVASNAFEVEQIKRDFEKNRKKIINHVKSMQIPAIIEEPIDLCKVDKVDDVENDTNIETNNTENNANDSEKVAESDINSNEILPKEQEAVPSVESQKEIQTEENLSEQKETKPEEIIKADNNTSENNKEVSKNEEDNVLKKDESDTVSELKQTEKEEIKTAEKPKIQEKQASEDIKSKENNVSATKEKSQKVKKKKNKNKEVYKIVNDKNEYYKSKKPRKVTKKDIKKRAKKATKNLKENL